MTKSDKILIDILLGIVSDLPYGHRDFYRTEIRRLERALEKERAAVGSGDPSPPLATNDSTQEERNA